MQNKNKKIKKTKKQIYKKTLIYIAVALMIFLSLPIIFKEDSSYKQNKTAQETLPLHTENPFTRYLQLFKDFYTPSKAKQSSKNFNLVKNKNADRNNPRGNRFAYEQEDLKFSPYNTVNEENNNTANNTNYYADMKEPTFYYPPENPKNPLVEKENFVPISVEGLYESSQTDPLEKKQAARKKLFGIFSPKRPLSLFAPSAQQEKDILTALTTPLTQPVLAQDIVSNNNASNNNILSTANRGGNFASGANNYASRGFADVFGNNNFVPNNFDISGLSFEDQASLTSDRLTTIRRENYEQAQANSNTNNNGNAGNQNNPNNPNNPIGPKPPAPPKNTFDPSKWDSTVSGSCSVEDNNPSSDNNSQLVDSTTSTSQAQETTQNTQNANSENTENSDPDKIDICVQDLSDRLKRVIPEMQANHEYIMISGRYQGRIMIPATLSLPDRVLTSIASDDEGFVTLNTPKELRGKKLRENTDKTEFEFVYALKPEAFNKIMQNEKTILLSVDEEDLQRFPDKTILVKSGEIETYSGTERIINELNNFPAKQAELKKLAKQQETQDKEKKKDDLKQKINSAL